MFSMLWTLSKRGEGGRVFMHLSSDDSMSQPESDVVSMSNLIIIKSLMPLIEQNNSDRHDDVL